LGEVTEEGWWQGSSRLLEVSTENVNGPGVDGSDRLGVGVLFGWSRSWDGSGWWFVPFAEMGTRGYGEQIAQAKGEGRLNNEG